MKKTKLYRLLLVAITFFATLTAQAKDYVIISEIMYDSPLNEQIATGVAYSNGEYVEIYNTGIDSVNLTGWTLRGGGSTEIYTFPSNTVLPAQGYLIVAYQYYNSGFTLDQLYSGFTVSPSHQVQYQRKIILSNSGEPVKLCDASGMRKDSIYIDGTINKTKANRLSAENADGMEGNLCVSVQRKTAVFDADGNAIPNNTEWLTSTVTQYTQNTAYTAPVLPNVTNMALPLDKNYIITVTPLDATTQVDISGTQVAFHGDAKGLTTIQYFDGLGRPMETVQRGITPSGKDLVTLTEYDDVGREKYQWLPKTTGGNGAFVNPTSFKGISESLYNGDSRPFAETVYEPSPLNRVTEQFGAGNAWKTANKRVTMKYEANGSEVKYFYADNNNQLVADGAYNAATLYKTTTTDEDGKPTVEYKDKLGRVVMQRNGTNVDTYYVYNDLQQLCYVLPALAADALGNGTYTEATDAVKKYGYVYKYDSRGNCISKKLPGCEPILMAYDKADRLIASQDGNQRTQSKITLNAYDALGRILYSVELTPSANYTIDYINSIFKNYVAVESYNPSGQYKAGDTGYTNAWFNFSTNVFLTVNYYDDYTFLDLSAISTHKSKLQYEAKQGYSARYTPPSGGGGVKGLLTGTRTYLLDGSGNYTTSVNYYDDKGAVVQTRSTNHLNGYDIVYNDLDFTGKPNKTLKEHNIAINGVQQPVISELYTYTYDHAQRLLTTTHQLNGGSAIVLATNAYDELGRLKTKTVGGTLDATNYSYNIRNWLTSISGSRFYEDLYYNTDPASLGATLCYNGNISSIKWKIPADNLGTDRAYTFSYDHLNRILFSQYLIWLPGIGVVDGSQYNESMNYDKQGNITELIRDGLTGIVNGNNSYGTVDRFEFNYKGNQLMSIKDNLYFYGNDGCFYGDEEYFWRQKDYGLTGDFRAYDTNGNVTSDINNNVWGIQYNLLNLPDKIQFYQGHQNLYSYSASGVKLKVTYKTAPEGVVMPVTSLNTVAANPTVASVSTTDYVGNYIYRDGALQMILLPEGYWQSGHYHYYLKDHLGSNRVVLRDDNTILERNHYYPSGMRFGESAVTGGSVQPYRHTGHEMQAMHGLNWIDNGARMRSVNLPIFTTVDPLAEKYYSISPYAWCGNNPVNAVDLDGRDITLRGYDTEALRQALQDRAGTSITIKLEDNGYLSYTVNDKDNISANAQNLMNSIDNREIQLDLISVKCFKAPDGTPMEGGAFLGNTVIKDNNGNVKKVIAEQAVNVDFINKLDNASKDPNANALMHEVTEAYIGAKNSIKSGNDAPKATETEKNNPNSAYSIAHNAAYPQPEIHTFSSLPNEYYTPQWAPLKITVSPNSPLSGWYRNGRLLVKFYTK